MKYIPVSEEERTRMLDEIGVSSVEELFGCVPDELKLKDPLNIPGAVGENELRERFEGLSSANCAGFECLSFLGAGAYRHYVPSPVNQLLLRSEFYSAYTPYQPEISQGTLQNIFEFQTMVCQLTGLDVSNASLYDGSTALAEGIFMADRIGRKKNKVLLAETIHPEYREVVKTYFRNLDTEIHTVPFDKTKGTLDMDALGNMLDEDTMCVAVQSPNFLGCIEDVKAVSAMAAEYKALSIVTVSEPFSMGLLKPPGKLGADIVLGELQGFGNPLNYGGPYLGFMAAKEKHVRQLPGRIAGQTEDADGTRGYVLTLATREQHIRREKATSNICTNQALCALSAAITMSCFGRKGLRRMAEINLGKAHYAADKIGALDRFETAFEAPFFNEFTVRTDLPVDGVMKALRSEGVMAGYPLGERYGGLEDCFLVCVTEMTAGKDIDRYISLLEKIN